jgi:hypothetical protein
MLAYKLAPPDTDFANRLRALSEAADAEALAWRDAAAAGLRWQSLKAVANAEPPYELRPGTRRRGPPELWERFDAAVESMNTAITGSDANGVAIAFAALADAAGALADAIGRERVTPSSGGESGSGRCRYGNVAEPFDPVGLGAEPRCPRCDDCVSVVLVEPPIGNAV